MKLLLFVHKCQASQGIFYGGPQLSRQKLIPRGKRKLLTAKENYPRQKEKTHGKKKTLAAKRKRLTAKRKTSRQKEKPQGKKKKTHGKKKNLAAKRKTSRQKEKDSRQKVKDSRQKEKPRGKKKKTRGKKKKTHGKKKRLTEKRKTDSRQKKKGHGGWPSFSKYSMGKKAVKRGGGGGDTPTRRLSHVFVSRLISKSLPI